MPTQPILVVLFLIAVVLVDRVALDLYQSQGPNSPAAIGVLTLVVSQANLAAAWLAVGSGHLAWRAITGLIAVGGWWIMLGAIGASFTNGVVLATGLQMAAIVGSLRWLRWGFQGEGEDVDRRADPRSRRQFSLATMLGLMLGFTLLLALAKNVDAGPADWIVYTLRAFGSAAITIISLGCLFNHAGNAKRMGGLSWLLVLLLVIGLEVMSLRIAPVGGAADYAMLRVLESVFTAAAIAMASTCRSLSVRTTVAPSRFRVIPSLPTPRDVP